MKKRVSHHVTHRKTHSVHTVKTAKQAPYLMVVRGWMFLVMFALMLGMGAVVGSYINAQLNGGQVAGVSTSVSK